MLRINSKIIHMRAHRFILGMRVDDTSYSTATDQILSWAQERTSRYVCIANVHMAMEAYDNPAFQKVVNQADMVTSDGVPLVWALKLLGRKKASRVYGPDLTLHVCKAAARFNISIGLYGGTTESLNDFTHFLQRRFPGIQIACSIAPPFHPLTDAEDCRYSQAINDSGAQILFVGIGCPKQERWMAAHKGQINAVMLGVGAAFDFHSGRVKQAPSWLQRVGLEWLFRLLMEPRRLWKRYAKHNPRFVLSFARQWLQSQGV